MLERLPKLASPTGAARSTRDPVSCGSNFGENVLNVDRMCSRMCGKLPQIAPRTRLWGVFIFHKAWAGCRAALFPNPGPLTPPPCTMNPNRRPSGSVHWYLAHKKPLTLGPYSRPMPRGLG